MKIAGYLLAAATVVAGPASADEFNVAMEEFFQSELSDWASNEMLAAAVIARNVETGGYTLDEIEALDRAWRAEVGQDEMPTIAPILENAASDFLREQVAAFNGRVTEIFVMDAQGLNVATSDVTSDFWQGDEDKHGMTYGAGAGALHISDVELDESTQRYQGQVSFTLVDPNTGAAVGAVTVGVDAESLM